MQPEPNEKKICDQADCKKKLKIIEEYSCKCNLFFCKKHRLFENHNCTYDHQKAQREKITKQNPSIASEKIQKI
jgi:predicted nucleic acid binding AN1-type Zn finger protein